MMQSLRVVLVCALVAIIATAAFAQDDAQCKKDGDAEGTKLAVELCTSVKAACEGGEKDPKTAATFGTATQCGRTFMLACSDTAATLKEPCASFQGNDKCALEDFQAIYREARGLRCVQAANKYSPESPAPAEPETAAESSPAMEDALGSSPAMEDVGSGPTIDEP